jgi:hypothetical protein
VRNQARKPPFLASTNSIITVLLFFFFPFNNCCTLKNFSQVAALVADRVWHFTPVCSPRDLSAEKHCMDAWSGGRRELPMPEVMQPRSQISDDQCRHRTRYRPVTPWFGGCFFEF